MNDAVLEIPSPVRLKAISEGQAGEAWLAGLAGVVADLAAEWGLSIGRALPGGTEAFVAEATMADGREAMLKVGLPRRDAAANELRALLAARGRGYAEVYAHDQAWAAMLLARLGPQVAELGLPVDTQIGIICKTLGKAWAPLPEGARFTNGAEKAKAHGEFIETAWLDLGRPCP